MWTHLWSIDKHDEIYHSVAIHHLACPLAAIYTHHLLSDYFFGVASAICRFRTSSMISIVAVIVVIALNTWHQLALWKQLASVLHCLRTTLQLTYLFKNVILISLWYLIPWWPTSVRPPSFEWLSMCGYPSGMHPGSNCVCQLLMNSTHLEWQCFSMLAPW